MIKLLATGLATVDALKEANKLREIALAKIARARYVRDITVEAKGHIETAIKLNAIRKAIHVGK